MAKHLKKYKMGTLKKPEILYIKDEGNEKMGIINKQVAKFAIHAKNESDMKIKDVASVATSANDSGLKHKANNDRNEIVDNGKMLQEDINQFIPDHVYQNLPAFLKDSCKIFLDKHERDVFLTGALCVLGGCFHNVYAFNEVDNRKVHVNLMGLVIAGPGSGKASLNYSKKLSTDVVNHFALNRINPLVNQQSKLLIPANISSAGLIQLLHENDGIGVMAESEIDTLVNANNQDWGNFSEVLRKAFENEDYSFYRKTEKEYLEIKKVRLAICLSGTPGQFKNLIKSTENGLFSRCCYYVFENDSEILKCFKRLDSNVEIDNEFSKFSTTLLEYYKSLLVYESVTIVFREYQLVKIQEMLQNEFTLILTIKELHANIKRSFITVQKIATILCILDMCEKDNVEELQYCNDLYLNVALTLTLIYLRHSYKAFELLPKKAIVQEKGFGVNHQRLLSYIPDEFTRAEFIKLGIDIGVSEKTGDNILKAFKVKGLVVPINHGKFRKAK